MGLCITNSDCKGEAELAIVWERDEEVHTGCIVMKGDLMGSQENA